LDKDPLKRFSTVQQLASAFEKACTQKQWPTMIELSKETPSDLEKAEEQWLEEASAFYTAGKYKEALAIYERIIQIDPSHAYLFKGVTLAILERFNEAAENFEYAIQIAPAFVLAHIGKGKAFRMLGQYEEALICFNYAAKLDSKSAEIYFNIGDALRNLGEI